MKLKLIINRFDETEPIDININYKTTFDDGGASKLISFMSKLQTSTKNMRVSSSLKNILGTEELEKATNFMTQFRTSIKNINKKTGDRVADPTGLKTISNEFANIKEVMKDLSPDTLEKLVGASVTGAPVERLRKYTTIMGMFKQIAGDTNKELEQTKNSTNEFGSNVSKMNKELGNTEQSSKKAESGLQRLSKLLKSSLLVQIQSLAHTLRRIFGFLEESFVAAGDYVESINLYTMSVGEYATVGQKWAEKISDALYLDTSEIYQYTGQFYNLTRGLGATAKAADLMSRNLTQLTYDMSSYLNIDVSVANNKLMSAMSGQTKAVTSVGIAVQSASLQELAYSLGIEKAVESMTQAEKTYLRYIQIMRTTTQMQGDLGRTIITPTNTMRLLRTQLNLLSRAIGQVFTPIIMSALPYVIAFTQALTELAQWLSGKMGYHLEDYLAPADSIKTLADNFEDLGDSAEGAGDKINRTLAPFDELNVVQKTSTGSGAGVDDSVLDQLEQYLTGYDMLEFYTTQMRDKIDSIKGSIKGVLEVAKTLLPIFGSLWAISKINKFAKAIKGLWTTSEGGVTLFGSLGTKLATVIKGTGEGATKMQNFATKLARVGTGLVALGAGLGLSYDGMYKLTKETGNATINIIEFSGGLASAAAGGALIGSAFGPAGTVIGAFTGLLAGGISGLTGFTSAIADLRREAAEKAVFGDLVISTENWTKTLENMNGGIDHSRDKLEELSNTIDTTKENFDKNQDTVSNYLYQFSIMGERISAEDGQKFKDSLSQLFSDANAIVDTSSEQALLIITNAMNKTTWLTEEEQKEIIKSVTTNGENRKKKVKNIENKVYNIYEEGIKDRGYLTDKEKNQIADLMKQIDELTTRAASQTETDLLLSQKKFNTNSSDLAKESYENLNEAAEKFTKEQKEIASKNYNEQMNLAKSNAYESLLTLKESNSDIADEIQNLWDLRENDDKEGYRTALEQLKTHNSEAAEKFEELWRIRYNLEQDAWMSYNNAENQWTDTTTKAYDTVTDNLAKKYAELLTSNEKNAWTQRRVIENTLKDMNIDFTEFGNKVNNALGRIGQSAGNTFSSKLQEMIKNVAFEINLQTNGVMTGTGLSIQVKKRAVGGFPDKGEFFVAREDGPEMVGKIGNKTAVANNDQITTAMTNAMLTALYSANLNGNNKQPIQNTIYIGSRKVFDGMNDYVDSENDRYGTNYVKV